MKSFKRIRNKSGLFLFLAIFFFFTTIILGWSVLAYTFTNRNIESTESQAHSDWVGQLNKEKLVDLSGDDKNEKVIIENVDQERLVLVVKVYEQDDGKWSEVSTVPLVEDVEIEVLQPDVLWNNSRYEITYKISGKESKTKVLTYNKDDGSKLYDKKEIYVDNGVAYYENISLYSEEKVTDKIDVTDFDRDQIINKLKEETGYFLTSLLKKNDLADSEFTVVNDEIVMYDDCYEKDDSGFFLPVVNEEGKLIVITNCYDSYGVDPYLFSVNDLDILYNDYKYILAGPCSYDGNITTVDYIFYAEHYSHEEVIDFVRLKDWTFK